MTMKKLMCLSILALSFSGCATTAKVGTNAANSRQERSIAGTLVNVQCWKGYSDADQNANLEACKKQASTSQICETNAWKHGQGAYEVCLRGISGGAVRVVSCLKGYSQVEQDENLKSCMESLSDGQICETNAWKHGHGAYDVCVME
jgi:hypothetical protein